MSGIVLSSSVRQNLLSLQSTAELLATTQNRLSTGKKVNTALDNPTNYFTAQGLDNRASDINNLLDGIGNGVQVLQAANTGITSLQKLIDTAKSIAYQALQTTVGYSTKSNVSTTIAGATSTDLRGTTTYGSAIANSNVLFSGNAGGTTPITSTLTLGGVAGTLTGTVINAAPTTAASLLDGSVTPGRRERSGQCGRHFHRQRQDHHLCRRRCSRHRADGLHSGGGHRRHDHRQRVHRCQRQRHGLSRDRYQGLGRRRADRDRYRKRRAEQRRWRPDAELWPDRVHGQRRRRSGPQELYRRRSQHQRQGRHPRCAGPHHLAGRRLPPRSAQPAPPAWRYPRQPDPGWLHAERGRSYDHLQERPDAGAVR